MGRRHLPVDRAHVGGGQHEASGCAAWLRLCWADRSMCWPSPEVCCRLVEGDQMAARALDTRRGGRPGGGRCERGSVVVAGHGHICPDAAAMVRVGRDQVALGPSLPNAVIEVWIRAGFTAARSA